MSELSWAIAIIVFVLCPEAFIIPIVLACGLIAMILLGIAAGVVGAWEWFTGLFKSPPLNPGPHPMSENATTERELFAKYDYECEVWHLCIGDPMSDHDFEPVAELFVGTDADHIEAEKRLDRIKSAALSPQPVYAAGLSEEGELLKEVEQSLAVLVLLIEGAHTYKPDHRETALRDAFQLRERFRDYRSRSAQAQSAKQGVVVRREGDLWKAFEALANAMDGHPWYCISYGEKCYAYAVIEACPFDDGKPYPTPGQWLKPHEGDDRNLYVASDGTIMMAMDTVCTNEDQCGYDVCDFIAKAHAAIAEAEAALAGAKEGANADAG